MIEVSQRFADARLERQLGSRPIGDGNESSEVQIRRTGGTFGQIGADRYGSSSLGRQGQPCIAGQASCHSIDRFCGAFRRFADPKWSTSRHCHHQIDRCLDTQVGRFEREPTARSRKAAVPRSKRGRSAVRRVVLRPSSSPHRGRGLGVGRPVGSGRPPSPRSAPCDAATRPVRLRSHPTCPCTHHDRRVRHITMHEGQNSRGTDDSKPCNSS
jgi:hypothetical protein